MPTATSTTTLQKLLSDANPNLIADMLRKANLGLMFSRIKAAFTGLTSSATQNITTAAAKSAATISGVTLDTGVNLPPIFHPIAVRVTAGTAAAGVRLVGDSGATPSATVCALSDDGTTLTFEAAVTGFVVIYAPLPAVSTQSSVVF